MHWHHHSILGTIRRRHPRKSRPTLQQWVWELHHPNRQSLHHLRLHMDSASALRRSMLASDHHLVRKDLAFVMKHSKRVFYRCLRKDWVYVKQRSKLVSCHPLRMGWEFDWAGHPRLACGHHCHGWSFVHCQSSHHLAVLMVQECHWDWGMSERSSYVVKIPLTFSDEVSPFRS